MTLPCLHIPNLSICLHVRLRRAVVAALLGMLAVGSASSGTTISGIVKNSTGQAVADATVVVQCKGHTTYTAACTGKDGAFAVELGERAPGVVWAAAPGCEPASADAVFDASLVLTLRTGRAVAGTVVVNRSGAPVVDARVEARLSSGKIYLHDPGIRACPLVPTATTDGEGRFTLDTLFAGEFYTLHTTAPGFADQDFELRPDPKEPPRIVLDPEAVLTGTVVDASSVAIPNATVEYTPLYAPPGMVVADASGRFRIGNLGTDFVSLRAWTSEYVPERLNTSKVKALPGRETECPPVRVVPGWFARITYVIRDTDKVVPRGMGYPRRTDLPWMTARTPIVSGSSVYGPLPAWKCHFVTHATGFCTDVSTDLMRKSNARIEDVSVVLTPHLRLWGTVVDQEGKPLFGVALTNLDSIFDNRFDYPESPGQHPRQSITDASGAYVFMADRLNTRFRLAAFKLGYATLEKSVNGKSGEVNYILTTGARLSGRVVMEDGSAPSDKTSVTLMRNRYDARNALTAECDSGGRYAFEHLPPGLCRLQAQSEHFFSAPAEAGEIEGTSDIVAKDLVLIRALKFGGKVVDEGTMKPIEGVRVTLLDARTRREMPSLSALSGVEGTFNIEHVPAGEYNYQAKVDPEFPDALYMFSDDYSPNARIKLVNDDITDYVIKGKAAARIEGRVVVAETGMPVAKVRVSADARDSSYYGGNFRNSASTDGSGNFSVLGVPGGMGLMLTAQIDGYPPAEKPLPDIKTGDVLQNVILELVPGRSVSGVVLDSNEKPVAGANVSGHMQREGLGILHNSQHLESDKEGKWKAEHLNPGAWQFAANLDKYSIATNDPSVTVNVTVSPDEDTTGVVLHLKDTKEFTGYLKGKVVDANGKPVANTSIQLQALEGRYWNFDQGMHSTNGAGVFEITKIPEGKYTLTLYTGGDVPYRFENIVCPQDNLVLKLEAKGGIIGHVVGPRGEAIGNFRAWLITRPDQQQWETGESRAQTFSSRDGLFEYKDLVSGSYRVQVSAEGFVTKTSEPILIQPGKTAETTIHLIGGGGVRVHVSDPQNKPVVGAMVLTEAQFGAWQQNSFRRPDTSRATDPAGDCLLSSLEPGTLTIYAWREGFAYAKGQTMVQAGRTSDLTLVLSAGGVIAGHVFDGAGKPVPNSLVGAYLRTPQASWQSSNNLVDAGGAYRITGLVAGKYSVGLSRREGSSTYTVANQSVDVAEGQTTTLDFTLAGGRIYGTVTKRGAPARGGFVSGYSSGIERSRSYNAQIDSEGKYQLTNVAPGELELRVAADRFGGWGGRRTKVVMPAEGDLQLDLTFPSAVVRGHVTTESGGTPIAGAKVSATVSAKADDPSTTMGGSETTSGADGAFELKDLPGGFCTVNAVADQYSNAESKLELAEDGEVGGIVLRLPSGGRLAGTVTVPGDYISPYTPYVTVAYPDDRGPVRSTGSPSVREGRYDIGGLPPGELRAIVAQPGNGLAPSVKRVVIETGKTTQADFVLQRGVPVTFNITDATGQVVDRATTPTALIVHIDGYPCRLGWDYTTAPTEYVVRLVPGQYAIEIVSGVAKDESVKVNVTVPASGEPPAPINVVLTPAMTKT